MKEVEVDAGDINWPQKCCRCGSKSFSIREHVEKVVLWSTGTVTKYHIVLLDIPVCSSCASAHVIWLSIASVAALIGAGGLYLWHKSVGIVLFWWVVAIVMALIGVNRKPIKVLKLDRERNRLRIRVYNDAVAAELRRKNNAKSLF
jgi:hypothetical protein